MSIVNHYSKEEYALCNRMWDGLVCGHGISHEGDNYCPICLEYASLGGEI